jgi:Carboxypeptidase regulatory-like domain
VTRRAKTLGWVVLAALLAAAPAAGQSKNGRLAGVVLDFTGQPQMGATVWVAAEGPSGPNTIRARTNQAGRFLLDRLPVGAYTIRVTLAGFLPALSRNVVVSANATTVLKLELDSVFSTVAQMRKPPKAGRSEPDDWDWVLRSSASTRPVLRWRDGGDDASTVDASARRKSPRARVELTSGGTEPGVVSSLTQSAFAYDQPIGMYGKLLLAGQFSYDAGGTAGLATTWAPFGSSADAPRTTVAVQQFRLGQQGQMLRTLRTEQAGSLHLSDRVTIHYAAEYVWISFRDSSSALHPRADVTLQLARGWTATVFAGSLPARGHFGPADLDSAMDQLGVFPAVMFHGGSPMIGNGWHEELRLEHRIVKNGELSIAGFRDQSSHTPVFATSVAGDAAPLDALPIAHAIDGGGVSTYGARAAYRQKLTGNLQAAVVYAWSGALSADELLDGAAVRTLLKERLRNSVAVTLGGHVRKTGTRFTTSYKWVNGLEASRQDPYGETLYDTDPFLNVSFRQALPVVIRGGRLEAVADLLNVLGEGTVYRNTADGRLGLTPAPRVLRGGLSFQF